MDGDDQPGRRNAGALSLRRVERLAARPRRHPLEGHAPHEGDRRHQPEQPDRCGLLVARCSRASPTSLGSTPCFCSPTRSTTASSSTTPCTSRWPQSRPTCSCLTFNGLSKTYRVAGYRSGWLVITGPKEHAAGFLEGINLLASTRLCPNVPAQHAVQAALSGVQSIDALIAPAGRLHEQRDAAWEGLEAIPGVSCVRPQGALYAFPRFDPEVYEIRDDGKFVYDFLVAEHVLLVQGTGFNWPDPDHVRIVTLPEARVLSEAIERLGNFLSSYRQ